METAETRARGDEVFEVTVTSAQQLSPRESRCRKFLDHDVGPVDAEAALSAPVRLGSRPVSAGPAIPRDPAHHCQSTPFNNHSLRRA